MNDLSKIASLLADPGRAAIALKLMGGVALPAGELARAANVAPQTASGHLGRMLEGGLLCVEHQGRHRYYRLSNAEVGDAIEALLRLTIRKSADSAGVVSQRLTAGTLAYARTCYSHLAGWLGVAITEAMVCDGLLGAAGDKSYVVTASGRNWLASAMGIPMPALENAGSERAGRRFARQCLDWTERRHHLSGELGIALYQRMLERRWIAPLRGTRAVRVTVQGKRALWDLLRIPIG